MFIKASFPRVIGVSKETGHSQRSRKYNVPQYNTFANKKCKRLAFVKGAFGGN